MKDITGMIIYLKEAIDYQTADDIYTLPREEFAQYVKRVEPHVHKAAIPHVVLFLLEEERKSKIYKIKQFLGMVK